MAKSVGGSGTSLLLIQFAGSNRLRRYGQSDQSQEGCFAHGATPYARYRGRLERTGADQSNDRQKSVGKARAVRGNQLLDGPEIVSGRPVLSFAVPVWCPST